MNEKARCIFSGLQILTGEKWETGKALVVEDNKIKALIPSDMIEHHLPARRYEFSHGCFLCPGFIDLHVHGANGADVMDASAQALRIISHALASEGVTSYLATTMTAGDERIEAALKAIASEMATNNDIGAAILGAHLEGPFIAKSKAGAQLADETQVPDIDLINHWQKLSNASIKLVTLAPELPEAIDFIKDLRQLNIVASVGHTNATFEETDAAIAAGCTQATHLFNAMSGIHQRQPGASGALLLSDKVTAELIVDRFHLHPGMVELALKVKGKDKLLLVTDAIRAKCLGDGQYELGGQTVDVQKGKATLADGTLAGSTLRMPQAIKNMIKYTNCSLVDAIAMATATPARVLGLNQQKGSIEVGKDADLVVLNDKLDVMVTMRNGKEIFRK